MASGTGIVFSDDEVTVASPSPSSDGMSVKNATITRLNIHSGVDGIKLGANSTVTGSWIHGLSAFASDPAQGGRATHNDAIQILSGTNIHISGNNLQVTSHNNSAIQVTQDRGTVRGLVVSSNWADGGGCTFNFSGHGPGGVLLSMSGITVVTTVSATARSSTARSRRSSDDHHPKRQRLQRHGQADRDPVAQLVGPVRRTGSLRARPSCRRGGRRRRRGRGRCSRARSGARRPRRSRPTPAPRNRRSVIRRTPGPRARRAGRSR